MLLTTVVPHHHHMDAVCIELRHNDTVPEHETSCANHLQITKSETIQHKRHEISRRWEAPSLIPITFSYLAHTERRQTVGHHTAFYHSPSTRGIHALRAPPVIYC